MFYPVLIADQHRIERIEYTYDCHGDLQIYQLLYADLSKKVDQAYKLGCLDLETY